VPALRVFELDDRMAPRQLFEIAAGQRTSIGAATITPLGANLLVTYTDRRGTPARDPPPTMDPYDLRFCPAQPITWLELRDARSGELRAAKTLEGYDIAAAVERSGAVVLGGAVAGDCSQDRRAALISVDARLETR